jgi:hypothetical protein
MTKLDTEPLEIAWTGGHTYVVGSPSTGEEGETNNAYRVSLRQENGPTCTCDAMTKGGRENGMCRHIWRAIMAHDSEPDWNRQAYSELFALYESARKLQNEAMSASGGPTGGASQDSQTAESGSQETETESGDVIREMNNPEPEMEELAESVRTWFVQAGGNIGFDPSIIVTKLVEVHPPDGAPYEGIEVELNPFQAGYWDDGDWQDKDGFDAEKETVRNTLLKPRDEFQWYGEPDYANVISLADAKELVE